MTLNRRGFFGAAAGGAVAAPGIGRSILGAVDGGGGQAGIPVGSTPEIPPENVSTAPKRLLMSREEALRMILNDPEDLAKMESGFYEGDYREVNRLDPDIENKKSFSLAAKIAFQRQRNVARRMTEIKTANSLHHDRISWLYKKINTLMFGREN